MRHEPARRFRETRAHYEDEEAQHRSNKESGTPAKVRGHQCGVEQHDRATGSEATPYPEAAVDNQIGPASISGGHKFLDGRGNGRVLAADASSGEKAEQSKAEEIP